MPDDLGIDLFFDRVAVQLDEHEELSTGGVVVLEQDNVPIRTGVVVGVGCGLMTVEGQIVPLQTVVGDRVILQERAPTMVRVGEKLFAVLREERLLGVVGEGVRIG